MRAILGVIGIGVVWCALGCALGGCSSDDDGKTAGGSTTTSGPTNGGAATSNPPTASARVAIDVKAFCNKATSGCGDTSTKESDCEAMFAAVRVSKECADALTNASCADLSSGTGAVESCFPPCSSPGTTQCNADGTLSVCGNASKALVYDCATTCSEVGKTWSGKCGTASDDQGSQATQRCLCK